MIIEMKIDKTRLPHLEEFIALREEALLCKQMGWEFTSCDTIRNHKFCNIDREHDTVTKWVKKHIRDRKILRLNYPNMVTELTIARIFNHPPTLENLIPFVTIEQLKEALYDYRDVMGEKIMRGAYMMPAHTGGDAIKYWSRAIEMVDFMFTPMDPPKAFSDIARTLQSITGIGGFVANQIITDLRYTGHMDHASDFDTFVLPGPGTRRGVLRLCGLPIKSTVVDSSVSAIVLSTRAMLGEPEVFRDPNNMSNTFCEYDKYCRALEQKATNKRITLKKYENAL